MNKSEIELKIKTIRNNNALPEKQKGMLIDKYEKMLAEMGGGEPAAKPKATRQPRTPKAPNQKSMYKGLKVEIRNDSQNSNKFIIWDVESKQIFANEKFDSVVEAKKFITQNGMKLVKTAETEVEYDCDDLIEDAKERKAKALAAYEKRKNAPKKSATTKAKETIEKAEKTVEKGVKKGDISISEIEKIISEYEQAIQKLKDLLERAKGKMKQGGSVDPEEVEHILMKAQGIKEHHCKCNDKMEKGGGVGESRIDKMVRNWNENGKAYSKISNNDNEFFERIGIPFDELGTSSDTGLDLMYYDTEKYTFGGRKKFGKGGPVGKEYKVFNYTDNLYATDETFDKMKDAKAFISMFRGQFSKQGYYKDNKGNKIAPKDIDLEIIPADFNPMPNKFAEGGSVENEISYIDSRIKNLSSMRAVANPDERDYFDNQISKLENEKANLSNPGKKRWFF